MSDRIDLELERKIDYGVNQSLLILTNLDGLL